MLPVPPALLRGLARRLAQVVAMQHHTLAVEGEHDDRPRGRRPAPLGLTRLVEGVEVGSRASHQLFRLTFGYLGGGTAGQLEQRFVERTRGGRDGHPAAHLERVTLRRQVQRRVERMQTVVTRARVAGALDRHRAEGRLQAAFVHPTLRALDTVGASDRTGRFSRPALVEMPLQQLAQQHAAPPVQFPFGGCPIWDLESHRSGSSDGLRANTDRTWPPHRRHRPPHTAPARVSNRS